MIERLWQLLPHQDGAQGPTTIRWFAKSGGEKWGGYADSPAELRNAIVHSPGKNFYVCPNPSYSKTGVRHKTADVAFWSWFFIDVDPIEPVRGDYDPKALLYAALLKMQEWTGQGLEPILIDSGRGLQAWFRLEDLTVNHPCLGLYEGTILDFAGAKVTTARTARLTMRYWLDRLNTTLGEQAGCHIDTTCSDLPRPMRCPDTINVRTGRRTQLLHDSDRVHVGLAQALIDNVPKKAYEQPVVVLLEGAEWQDVLVHLTIKAQDYLTKGALAGKRHEAMWHTARTLAERGLTEDAVRRALAWANMRQGPDNALEEKDIEHAITTAFTGLTS